MGAIDSSIRLGIVDSARLARATHALGDLVEHGGLHKGVFDSGRRTIDAIVARQTSLHADITAAMLEGSAAVGQLDDALAGSSAALDAARRAASLLETVATPGGIGRVPVLSRFARWDATAAGPSIRELEAALTRTDEAVRGLSDEAVGAIERARQVRGADALEPEVARAAADDVFVRRQPRVPQKRIFGITRMLLGDSLVVNRAGNDPARGASLIVGTHGSNFDGPIIGAALRNPEPVRTMIQKGAMKVPGIGMYLKRLGGFPVDYSNSSVSLGRARAMLAAGQDVALFPEGRMVYGPYIGEAKAGALRLAISEGVPIMPTASFGTKPWWTMRGMSPFSPRMRVVSVGDVIRVDQPVRTKADLEAVLERTWRAVDAEHQKAQAMYERLYPGFREGVVRRRVIAGTVLAGTGAAAIATRRD